MAPLPARIMAYHLALLLLLAVTSSPAYCAFPETGQGLSLELALAKNRAYPGETVPVVATLHVYSATVRNVGYPKLLNHRITFAPVNQHEATDGQGATRYQFTGMLTLDKPGTALVGPAQLECEVMEPAKDQGAYFGAVEPIGVVVESPPTSITIVPLPPKRPPSFSGAIGAFAVEVTTKPLKAMVGEPLTVVTHISGRGNLSRAECPKLMGPGANEYPVKTMREAGTLTCEQLVIPVSTTPLPPVEWSYFDPEKGRFHIERVPLPEPVQAETPETYNSRSSVLPPNPDQERSRPAWPAWTLLASSLVIAALLLAKKRKVNLMATGIDPKLAEPDISRHLPDIETALREVDVERFYTLLFSALQEIAECKPDTIEASSAYQPEKGQTYSLHAHSYLVKLADSCDHVRYGRYVPTHEEMRSDFKLFQEIIQSAR